MENRKFYWLKLKRDFFKRHDIRIVEEMENGKDYLLFYLKMLLESIDHEGELRFSETIPYNEKMLSVITNTNIDIVRSAMKVFVDLKMIEILDDSTIYMTEVLKLTGSETASAERKRKSRKNQQLLAMCDNVTNECDIVQKSHIEIEKEIEKELELEKDKDNKSGKPTKPTKHKYGEFKNVLLTDEELEKLKSEFPDWLDRIERLSEYIEQKGNKYKNHYVTIRVWARKDKEGQSVPQKKGTMDSSLEWYEIAKEMEQEGETS